MSSKILDEASAYPTPTFVERHFSNQPTTKQIVFDVIMGMIMPVLCFYLDPGIIRGGLLDMDMGLSPGRTSMFIYIFSGLAIPVLALWLLLGGRDKRWGGAVGGVLLASAALSFIIGIIILPLSIIGLFYGMAICVLGFIPLLTAFVYLRNGLRAIESTNDLLSRFQIIGSILIGGVLIISVSVMAQSKISQIASESMAQILGNDDSSIDDAVNRAKYFKWLIDTRPILLAYEKETDSVRKERLAKAYKEIAGEDIELSLRIIRD